MKITVMTCLSAIGYVNINSCQSSTFDVKVTVFAILYYNDILNLLNPNRLVTAKTICNSIK